jgi:hypothetical protein
MHENFTNSGRQFTVTKETQRKRRRGKTQKGKRKKNTEHSIVSNINMCSRRRRTRLPSDKPGPQWRERSVVPDCQLRISDLLLFREPQARVGLEEQAWVALVGRSTESRKSWWARPV